MAELFSLFYMPTQRGRTKVQTINLLGLVQQITGTAYLLISFLPISLNIQFSNYLADLFNRTWTSHEEAASGDGYRNCRVLLQLCYSVMYNVCILVRLVQSNHCLGFAFYRVLHQLYAFFLALCLQGSSWALLWWWIWSITRRPRQRKCCVQRHLHSKCQYQCLGLLCHR